MLQTRCVLAKPGLNSLSKVGQSIHYISIFSAGRYTFEMIIDPGQRTRDRMGGPLFVPERVTLLDH